MRVWVSEPAELGGLTGASSTMSCSQEQKQEKCKVRTASPPPPLPPNTPLQRSEQIGEDGQTLVDASRHQVILTIIPRSGSWPCTLNWLVAVTPLLV